MGKTKWIRTISTPIWRQPASIERGANFSSPTGFTSRERRSVKIHQTGKRHRVCLHNFLWWKFGRICVELQRKGGQANPAPLKMTRGRGALVAIFWPYPGSVGCQPTFLASATHTCLPPNPKQLTGVAQKMQGIFSFKFYPEPSQTKDEDQRSFSVIGTFLSFFFFHRSFHV